MLRVNLSVAIVAMTVAQNKNQSVEACPSNTNSSTNSSSDKVRLFRHKSSSIVTSLLWTTNSSPISTETSIGVQKCKVSFWEPSSTDTFCHSSLEVRWRFHRLFWSFNTLPLVSPCLFLFSRIFSSEIRWKMDLWFRHVGRWHFNVTFTSSSRERSRLFNCYSGFGWISRGQFDVWQEERFVRFPTDSFDEKGPAFPSIGALWGRWVPPLERSIIPPIAQAGEIRFEPRENVRSTIDWNSSVQEKKSVSL